jgi:hypothetical protein
MVHLTTVVGTVQGHLVVGRLKTEGVDAVMSGPGDGPYPFPSEVEILVPKNQLPLAREVLLANDVEAVFDDEEATSPRRRVGLARWRLRRKASP